MGKVQTRVYSLQISKQIKEKKVYENRSSPLPNLEPNDTNNPETETRNIRKQNEDISIVIVGAKTEELERTTQTKQ